MTDAAVVVLMKHVKKAKLIAGALDHDSRIFNAVEELVAEREKLRELLTKCDTYFASLLHYSMPGFPLEKDLKTAREELRAALEDHP